MRMRFKSDRVWQGRRSVGRVVQRDSQDGVERGKWLLEHDPAEMICRMINRVIRVDAFRRATEGDTGRTIGRQDCCGRAIVWDFARALRPKTEAIICNRAGCAAVVEGRRRAESPPSCCGNGKGAMEGEIRCRRALHASGSSESWLVLLLKPSCLSSAWKARIGLRASDQHVEVCRRTDVQCRMDPARVDHARTATTCDAAEGCAEAKGKYRGFFVASLAHAPIGSRGRGRAVGSGQWAARADGRQGPRIRGGRMGGG